MPHDTLAIGSIPFFSFSISSFLTMCLVGCPIDSRRPAVRVMGFEGKRVTDRGSARCSRPPPGAPLHSYRAVAGRLAPAGLAGGALCRPGQDPIERGRGAPTATPVCWNDAPVGVGLCLGPSAVRSRAGVCLRRGEICRHAGALCRPHGHLIRRGEALHT